MSRLNLDFQPCHSEPAGSDEITLNNSIYLFWGFPGGSVVKSLPAMQETREIRVWFVGWENTREEETATRSSILAYKIPRTEEPGGPQSIVSQTVRHFWVCTHIYLPQECSTFLSLLWGLLGQLTLFSFLFFLPFFFFFPVAPCGLPGS